MLSNNADESIVMTPTPSQHLFSVWNGLCGNTVVCSGVTFQSPAEIDKGAFSSAWSQWVTTSYEINISVDYRGEKPEPLVLTLDGRQPDENCFRFINSELLAPEQVIQEELQTLLNAEMNTANKNSHTLLVIKFSQHRYAVLLAVEHMLADGLGVDVLLNRYLALLDQPGMDTLSARERYYQDKKHLDNYAAHKEISSSFTRQYAENILTKRFFWNPDNKSLMHRKGCYKTIQKSVPAATLQKINRHLTAHRISLFSWLTGCFVDSFLAYQPALNELLLQIPTHGRKHNNQSLDKNRVGCFAQAFLLPMQRKDHEEKPSAQRFTDLQRYVLECMGNEVDQLMARRNAVSIKESLLPARLNDDAFAIALRKSMPTNLYFSFYGATSLPLRHESFDIDRYYLATTNLSGALDVMIIQYGESLEVSFNYDSLFFEEETIARLAECFGQQLENVMSSAADIDIKRSASPADRVMHSILIDCINKYSLEPAGESDGELHLEIDLGLDSLLKTRVLVDFMARARCPAQAIDREKFYSAVTLMELFNVVSTQPQAEQIF
ncbi:condensation domain-containing protein [Erwinia sp. CGal63]|uniref:condensation domain-containing protein n=1 Tax=Erwinia sp. CGal63 TaxID=2919889 RepID=UPI0030086769